MQISNAHRIAQNTGFLFLRMVFVLAISLYTSRVVLKTLGVNDFAIYNVVGSVVVFFSFFQAALNNATYRYLAYELGLGDGHRIKQIYSMAINSHCLLAASLFFVLEVGGVWFVNNHLNIEPDRLLAANWAYQFSLLTFCTNIIRTPFNSSIIAHERMNFYAFVSIIEVLFKLGIVYLLVLSPIDKLITYSALLFLTGLIVFICYVIYCRIVLTDCRYYRFWDSKVLKQFAAYSGWSMIVNVADVSTAQCISIFFFNMLGTVANASLGIANQVIGALNSFLQTFTQAFNPQIIKSYAAAKYDTFKRLLFSTSKISFLLLLVLAVPIVANIDFVLKVWLGTYPDYAPRFIQIIVVFSLIDACQAPLWQAVHATGNIRTHQVLMFSIKILAIPLVYLALRLGYGGDFSLGIWVFLNLLCAIVRTIYMKSLIQLDIKAFFNNVLLKLILITVLSVPISFYIAKLIDNKLLAFFVSSSVAVLIVILGGYYYVLDEEERNILKTMPIINRIVKE